MVIYWPALAGGLIGAVVGHLLWREFHTIRLRLREQGSFYIAEARSWRTGTVRAFATEQAVAITRALDEVESKGFPIQSTVRILANGKIIYP